MTYDLATMSAPEIKKREDVRSAMQLAVLSHVSRIPFRPTMITLGAKPASLGQQIKYRAASGGITESDPREDPT